MKAQEKNEIIYVFDALCGWCYGFSPVIQKLEEKYGSEVDFSIYSGGLALGDNKGPVSQMAEYILGAIPRLEEFTGVEIGEKYKEVLRDGSRISDSEPPARALAVFKEMLPNKSIQIASAIQKAMFIEGKDLNLKETYISIAQDFGIDTTVFEKNFDNETSLDKAHQDFAQAKYLGITGYPAVIAKVKGQYYLIAKGYRDFESLDEILESKLQILQD
jgi:putative protein-disulfide isomerase